MEQFSDTNILSCIIFTHFCLYICYVVVFHKRGDIKKLIDDIIAFLSLECIQIETIAVYGQNWKMLNY